MPSRSPAPLPELPPPRHRLVPADEARDRDGIAIFMGSADRKGDWEMPRHFRVACILGSSVLDLREARIPSGRSVLEVIVVAGSIELLVPPGVQVQHSLDSFMSEASIVPDPSAEATDAGPVIHVVGSVYLGSVETHVRLPGEGAREAKRRIRALRRAQTSRAFGGSVVP